MTPDTYARLAPAVQAFHRLQGRVVLHGEVQVEPPAGRGAGWLARLLGTPLKGARGPIVFELHAAPQAETWVRHFPQRRMASRLTQAPDGTLAEHLGWARLRFALVALPDGQLRMELLQLRCLGLACPRWLLPRITAQERGDAARLYFHVEAEMPFLGRVARYVGHLDLPATEPSP